MAMTPYSIWEHERQASQREFCLELIKQRWYIDRTELDVRALTAQVLRLFSGRFNIYTAEPRIAEQLGAAVGRPEEEVHATLPHLKSEAVHQLIDEIGQAIAALKSKTTREPPTERDFREALSKILSALVARRYIVIHSPAALNRHRRWSKRYSNLGRRSSNCQDASVVSLIERLRIDLWAHAIEFAEHWNTVRRAVGIARSDYSRLVYISTHQGANDMYDYELTVAPVSPRGEFASIEQKDSVDYAELLAVVCAHLRPSSANGA